MANKYSVVQLDKVRSVYFGGGHIHSVRVPAGGLENGNVVKVGANEPNDLEIREALVPTADDKVALIAQPAINYDQHSPLLNLESQFKLEEGTAGRAYDLEVGDEVSVSEEGFTTLPTVVGDVVVAGGYKLTKGTKGAGTAFEVIGFKTVGGLFSMNVTQTPIKYVQLRVTQA